MVNQLSSARLWPPADFGSAVESGVSIGKIFMPRRCRFGGAVSQGWLSKTSRSFADVLTTNLGRSLAKILSGLQAVRQPWWALSNRLLADIGKTRAQAESEKLLHWQTVHYPREPFDQDIRLLSDLSTTPAPPNFEIGREHVRRAPAGMLSETRNLSAKSPLEGDRPLLAAAAIAERGRT
jgi:hypothetical protein